jgi:hypothetical protein
MDPERAKYLRTIAFQLEAEQKVRRYFEKPTPEVVT